MSEKPKGIGKKQRFSSGEKRLVNSEAEEHPAYSSFNLSGTSNNPPIFDVSLNSNGLAANRDSNPDESLINAEDLDRPQNQVMGNPDLVQRLFEPEMETGS